MKIIFSNSKIFRLPHIVECLSNDTEISTRCQSRSLHVMAGLGETQYFRLVNGFQNDVLIINSAAIPELRANHRASSVFLGSPCPSLCVKLPPDQAKFDYLADKYSIPKVDEWQSRPTGPILVMLPRANGWKYALPDLKRHTESWLATIFLSKSSDDTVLVRFHPREKSAPSLKSHITDFAHRRGWSVAFDDPSNDARRLLDTAKCVATPWGTGHVPFLIRGIKCVNLAAAGSNPTQVLGHFAMFPDVRAASKRDPTVSPRQAACEILSNHFDADQFRGGEFAKWLMGAVESL